MDVVYERCCGLDIHKKAVVACLLSPGPNRKTQKAVRTFGTMTEDLLALAAWLGRCGVHARGDGGHQRVLEPSCGDCPHRPA